MVKRIRRAGRKLRLRKCLFGNCFELYEAILADTLVTNLNTWNEEIIDGACSKNTAGSTAEIAEDAASRCSKSLLTLTPQKSGSDNNQCIPLNSVLDDARSTMAESCHDSSIEDIILVLDSSDESTMDDTSSPNEENTSHGCDQSEATCIPFLTDSLENTIVNIFGDDTEYETSVDDNYGKLEMDLDLTPETIETPATEAGMLDERVGTTAGLPASRNTFWNFVERLTNLRQNEQEEWLDSADCKSTPPILSHEKAESRVPILPCTKNSNEDSARRASTSNEIVEQNKKCPLSSGKAGSDEKKSIYGRFDEELAKLDEHFTTKPHKVVSTEKLSFKKNSPITNETVSMSRTRTTSDTKCDINANKKHTIHEIEKTDKARKKSISGLTNVRRKQEIPGKIDVTRRKNVDDAATKSKKQEISQCEEIDKIKKENSEASTTLTQKQEHSEFKQKDVIRKKSSEGSTALTQKQEYPELKQKDIIRKKSSEGSTAITQKQEHPELKQKDVIRKKSSERDTTVTQKQKHSEPKQNGVIKRKSSERDTTVTQKQKHCELKQNYVIEKKSSEAAAVTSKEHKSHEHEKADIFRHKNSGRTTPELIADKVGAEICKPHTNQSGIYIKVHGKIHQYLKSDSIRTESCTSNAQEKSHSGNTTVNISETILKEDRTTNVIHNSNNTQTTANRISSVLITGVHIADRLETDKPPIFNKTNSQRKRVQQLTETDCPLKKHKSYSLATDDANDITRRKRKRLRKKLREIFGVILTTSEEKEEDMMIQKKRRKRKHSTKSNDSGISVRGNNVMTLVPNEALREIENPSVCPLRTHGKHDLEKVIQRLMQKQNVIDKPMESTEIEHIQTNVEILPTLPEIDKKSAPLGTNEVADFEDKTPAVITPIAKSTENNTRKSNDTRKQPESPTKDIQIDSSSECGSLKCSKRIRIRSTSTNSGSSNVVSLATTDQAIDPISKGDTACSNVVSNDDDNVFSSQDHTKSVNTDLHSSTPSPQLQEDFTELLEINVIEKIYGHYQVVTKGNVLSIEEIKDVNQNVIKQQSSIIVSVPTEAKECAFSTKSTHHQNESGEKAKHFEQSIAQKDVCHNLKDMPLLEELTNIGIHRNNENNVTPTIQEATYIVNTLESNQNSTRNSVQHSQSDNCSTRDIVEPPAPIFGQLRVRTSEELGSRWCPTPAIIPTPEISTVTSVITSTSRDSSKTNANTHGPDPIIPTISALLHTSTTETVPEIPKTTNPNGMVTVTVHERKKKASRAKDLQAHSQHCHPRISSQKSASTAVCDAPQQGESATLSYTHRTPVTISGSNKRAKGQIANATGASNRSQCNTNTLITGQHPSLVPTGTNMIPAQLRSGAVTTSSKQSPIYSTVALSNNMPLMNVSIEPNRTASISAPHADLYKYALSNQQAHFRVPVTMPNQTNPHSVYTQNNRVAQHALQRLASMNDQLQYPFQGPSANGPPMGSALYTLLSTPNPNSNGSLPSHNIGTSTYIPGSSNVNTSTVDQQMLITAGHQYNQQVPLMNQQVPLVNIPSLHKQIPVRKQKAQVALHQIPLNNHQYPNLAGQLLVTNNQAPVMKPQIAVLSQQRPLFNGMSHQPCYHPVNPIIQQSHIAQSLSLNLTQQAVPVIAVAQEQRVSPSISHAKQTPSPPAQKRVNFEECGQQGLQLQNNQPPSKELRTPEMSPQLSSTKCGQQTQLPTTVEAGPLQQRAEISNPPNAALQPAALKKNKFGVLKKLRLEQQIQLVRQIDCYLINCFSLSQYMTKVQWNEAQSTKSVLMELKTVLDNHIKVLLQDYCYELSSDTYTSDDAKKPIKTKAEDSILSVEPSNIKSKNSEEEKLNGKTGNSIAPDESTKTESKPDPTEEKLKELKEGKESTASTDGTKIPKEMKNRNNVYGETRMNEEEMEILRAMYREWCEPEDSETNDSEDSRVNTSDSQVSADSYRVKTEADDSAIGKITVNSSIMERINNYTGDVVSTNNDKDIKSNYRTKQSSIDNDENTTSSVETLSFVNFADPEQVERNTKQTTSKIRTHSSESSRVVNTPVDFFDIDEKRTISNADIETCATDTVEDDCEYINHIKSEAANTSEDTESTSEHLECISHHDETTCTSILSLSDDDSSSFETSADIKPEDIDNRSENLVNVVAPLSPKIAIADITSITVDTFNTLDKSIEHEIITIDGDDIEEMCESKSCLQCGEPSVVVCGGCLEAQYCLTHCSDSTWKDHCKECRSLNADVTCD